MTVPGDPKTDSTGPSAGILLLAFGNPGRLDDGLGPALGARIEALDLEDVTVSINYQLVVEDADRIARCATVIFIDAAVEGPDPFTFARVDPDPHSHCMSHVLEPPALLHLARALYGAAPEAYVLAIRGHDFDAFGEYLSTRAASNLRAAIAFLVPKLRDLARARRRAPAGVQT